MGLETLESLAHKGVCITLSLPAAKYPPPGENAVQVTCVPHRKLKGQRKAVKGQETRAPHRLWVRRGEAGGSSGHHCSSGHHGRERSRWQNFGRVPRSPTLKRDNVVRDANMGHQLAGGNSSWCPEIGVPDHTRICGGEAGRT